MKHERMTLRLVGPPDIWLVTWKMEDGPVWAVVTGRSRAGEMMAEVVAHAREIPWRSDAASRLEVGRAALAVAEARDT